MTIGRFCRSWKRFSLATPIRMRNLVLLAISATLSLGALPACAQQTDSSVPFRGKTALVTGSTDGLGREVARELAASGAHVIIHGRNAERGRALVDEITKQGKGSARFIAADFASLAAGRKFADSIAKLYPRIDLLVNNAGISLPRGESRRTSVDGHELHFAVNYLPGWILVHRLRPALQAAAPSRVINVASRAQSPIDFSDVMLEKPGAFNRGYGQSKLAQITMSVELAPDFQKSGITMVSLHPASMMNTAMVRGLGVEPRSTVDEGLTAVMNLVTMRTLEPGAYYNGTQPATPHPQSQDTAARAQLRALSARLTNVK